MKARVDELVREFDGMTRVKAEWVLETVAGLLDFDPGELYRRDPADPKPLRLRPLHDLPARVRKAITRIKLDPETGQPVYLVLADKMQIASILLRALILVEGPSVAVNIGLGARLEAALRRDAIPSNADGTSSRPAAPAHGTLQSRLDVEARLAPHTPASNGRPMEL